MGLQGIDGIPRLLAHDLTAARTTGAGLPAPRGLGKSLLWTAAGAAALFGVIMHLRDSGGTYFMPLDKEPDLSPLDALSPNDKAARRQMVFDLHTKHIATHGAPVFDALQGLQELGVVESFEPRPFSNGFTVTVASGQGNEFRQALGDIPNVLPPVSNNLR